MRLRAPVSVSRFSAVSARSWRSDWISRRSRSSRLLNWSRSLTASASRQRCVAIAVKHSRASACAARRARRTPHDRAATRRRRPHTTGRSDTAGAHLLQGRPRRGAAERSARAERSDTTGRGYRSPAPAARSQPATHARTDPTSPKQYAAGARSASRRHALIDTPWRRTARCATTVNTRQTARLQTEVPSSEPNRERAGPDPDALPPQPSRRHSCRGMIGRTCRTPTPPRAPNQA